MKNFEPKDILATLVIVILLLLVAFKINGYVQATIGFLLGYVFGERYSKKRP